MFDPLSVHPLTEEAEKIVAKSWQDDTAAAAERQDFRLPFDVLSTATGDFSAVCRIGGGGSCEVFSAVVYGVPVAVKVLKINSMGNPTEAEAETQSLENKQFLSEMRLLQTVRHTNICPLLAVSVNRDHCCLVLRLCGGGTLHDRLKKSSAEKLPLTCLQKIEALVGILRALSHLHSLKIIHRDVKTTNCLLVREDQEYDDMTKLTMLADFGTVRKDTRGKKADSEDDFEDTSSTDIHSHATTRQVIGTRPYMCNDYITFGHVSEKTDAFASGIVLLELLTGLDGYRARQLLESTPTGELVEVAMSHAHARQQEHIKEYMKEQVQERAQEHTPSSHWKWSNDVLERLCHLADRWTQPRRRDRSTVQQEMGTLEMVLGDARATYMCVQAEHGEQDNAAAAAAAIDALAQRGHGGHGFDYMSMEMDSPDAPDAKSNAPAWRTWRTKIGLVIAVVVIVAVIVAVELRRGGGSSTSAVCSGQSSGLASSQCQAWQEMFVSLSGANWHFCSTNLTDPCACSNPSGGGCGPGVTCAGQDIVSIGLDFNNVVGTIPSAIGELSALQCLSIADQRPFPEGSHISGSIPPEITKLTALQTLRLFSNYNITGRLPASLDAMTSLVQLNLYQNQLTGTIPSSISSLTRLQLLDLLGNKLTGTVPTSLSQLSSLNWLRLTGNLLTGLLPPLPFGSYQCCSIAGNMFSCPLPDASACVGSWSAGPVSNCGRSGAPTCATP